MGQVLRFPAAARRIGDDAQLIPWNTSLLHTGMAELNERLEKAQTADPAGNHRQDRGVAEGD